MKRRPSVLHVAMHIGLAAVLFANAWPTTDALGQDQIWSDDVGAQLRFARFGVSMGRITADPPQLRADYATESSNKNAGQHERFSIRKSNGGPSVRYEAWAKFWRLTVDVSQGNAVRIIRSVEQDATVLPFTFEQSPGAPLLLEIETKDSPVVAIAADIWQLWLLYPGECDTYLLPCMHRLNLGDRLTTGVQQIRKAMLSMAKTYTDPTTASWKESVRKLAANDYAARRAAEIELRSAGHALLPFLNDLDPRRLDAEQRHRIRRLRHGLSNATQDRPETVATWLMPRHRIWLAFLQDADADTRHVAKTHLEKLMGDRLPFTVEAPLHQRQAQLSALRKQLRSTTSP